jgi:hypothetical protein
MLLTHAAVLPGVQLPLRVPCLLVLVRRAEAGAQCAVPVQQISPAAPSPPCRDPSQRPSAREALSHPWLRHGGPEQRSTGKPLNAVVAKLQRCVAAASAGTRWAARPTQHLYMAPAGRPGRHLLGSWGQRDLPPCVLDHVSSHACSTSGHDVFLQHTGCRFGQQNVFKRTVLDLIANELLKRWPRCNCLASFVLQLPSPRAQQQLLATCRSPSRHGHVHAHAAAGTPPRHRHARACSRSQAGMHDAARSPHLGCLVAGTCSCWRGRRARTAACTAACTVSAAPWPQINAVGVCGSMPGPVGCLPPSGVQISVTCAAWRLQAGGAFTAVAAACTVSKAACIGGRASEACAAA